MLKNLSKILIILLSIYLFNSDNMEYEIKRKNIDNIIIDKVKNREYDGYIYIPKLEYKGLIKHGNSNDILSSNNVLLFNNGSKIDDKFGNIVLAGHNNKYVFSILYKLSIDDRVVLSDFDNNYEFIIDSIKIVNIKDTYILDNIYDEKIITLITCTSDNQRRLIIRGKLRLT